MELTSLFSRKTKWDWGLLLSYDIELRQFFEVDLLSNVVVNNNLTIVIDESSYKKLFLNPEETPNYLGVYYNLEKIRISHGGLFHPKFYLFLSEKELLLALGSFNITKTGFKKNLESIAQFHFKKESLKNDELIFLGQIKNSLKSLFLEEVSLIDPISENFKDVIKQILNSNFFEEIDDNVQTDINNSANFITSLEKSIFSNIKSLIGSQFEKIEIISPFFDHSINLFYELSKISNSIDVYIPQKNSTFPIDLINDDTEFPKNLKFYKVNCEEHNIERFIHLKLYRFTTKDGTYNFVGSGNFTGAGFFNDNYPRNLEIGVLYPTNSKKPFLDKSIVSFDKLDNFRDLECSERVKHEEDKIIKNEEDLTNIIEDAVYKDAKIYFGFQNEFTEKIKDNNISKYQAILYLDKKEIESCNFQKDKKPDKKSTWFFEPKLEIEGNNQIQFKIISNSLNFESLPAFVNREKHEPNYLPSLGASAYNDCIKLGGEEGIAKAFNIAKTSGEEDWLIYLLSHWNLEKILHGLEYSEQEETEIEDTEIPSLQIQKVNKALLKKNISMLSSKNIIFERLEGYIQEFNERNVLNIKTIQFYNKYCFPLFLELSKFFYGILQTQERIKAENPQWSFPKYTWLHNYNEYKKLFNFIFKEINNMYKSINNNRQNIGDEYFIFIVKAIIWINNHTSNTIEKFEEGLKDNFFKFRNTISREHNKCLNDLKFTDIDYIVKELENYEYELKEV